MGIGDRPYSRADYRGPRGMGGMGNFQEVLRRMMGVGAQRPAYMVKALLWINIIIFIFQQLLDAPTLAAPVGPLSGLLGVTVAGKWQLWRYITFQFLHGGFWHIALNMLGLFMLGRPLERELGPVRFLTFYLSCGVVAGISYVLMGLWLGPFELPVGVPLIGASGGVFAILLACAVRFPQMMLILFLFPVRIRVAAAIVFGGMILLVLSTLSGGQATNDFWSQVAHLGGAVGACIWLWGLPKLMTSGASVGAKVQQGAWKRKMKKREETDKTVDEVLRKIHDQGINSLTAREKKILAEATARQREEE